jgi:RHH-type rel operon transcriptional repressor/antitoxin RelB
VRPCKLELQARSAVTLGAQRYNCDEYRNDCDSQNALHTFLDRPCPKFLRLRPLWIRIVIEPLAVFRPYHPAITIRFSTGGECYNCIAGPLMLAIRLPDNIEKRLAKLAKRTGRTKTYYAREAILLHLEDLEDVYIAEKRLAEIRSGRVRTIPLEEVMRDHASAKSRSPKKKAAR